MNITANKFLELIHNNSGRTLLLDREETINGNKIEFFLEITGAHFDENELIIYYETEDSYMEAIPDDATFSLTGDMTGVEVSFLKDGDETLLKYFFRQEIPYSVKDLL